MFLNGLFTENVIIDGEIVVLDDTGKANFQRLQNSIKKNQGSPFIYFVFDLIYYDQYNLSPIPLIDRKNTLHKLMKGKNSPLIRYSDHIFGSGRKILQKICQMGLEGIISKDSQSPYRQRRSKSWLKIKCLKRQEFVIAGYTPPQGTRQHFGSLLLGTFNKRKELIYNGNVGTGFTESSLALLAKRLAKYTTSTMPFAHRPPGSSKIKWLKPVLIAEVEFAHWTQDNKIRHASFKGLRNDKSPKHISKEKEECVENITQLSPKSKKAIHATKQQPRKKILSIFNYHLTNPNKLIYAEDNITKREFAEYYNAISEWILPYVVNRPLTLLRCPGGYRDECFYQKHLNKSTPSGLMTVMIKEKNNTKEKYIYIEDKVGLMTLAQMVTMEIHPWGSRIEELEYPDVIVFDLDPSPEVIWKQVVEAAFDVKHLLTRLHLKSFVKTTGGKGIHVVVPIKPEYSWQEIKIFSRLIADFLVKQNPNLYVDQMTKAKRKGKVFIDYMRNQRGATAIAPYSTRARTSAPVAMPIAWRELTDDFNDTFYTIKTARLRLATLKKDPWADFWTVKQSLNLKKLK